MLINNHVTLTSLVTISPSITLPIASGTTKNSSSTVVLTLTMDFIVQCYTTFNTRNIIYWTTEQPHKWRSSDSKFFCRTTACQTEHKNLKYISQDTCSCHLRFAANVCWPRKVMFTGNKRRSSGVPWQPIELFYCSTARTK